MQPLGPDDPARLAGYRLVARLGEGGMGRVFLARSPGGRPVALKVIRDELAANPEFRERFVREVAAARAVSGVFTAPVLDADPRGNPAWLATGYVAGISLQDAVGRYGPLPLPAVRTLAAGLAEALIAVHSAGVVHRDLKPANVMLAADGPKLIDFGIARALDDTGVRYTQAGTVIGSPAFLSPEQINGRPVGPPGDVFSLASVLVYALTGHRAFTGDGPVAVLYAVVNGEPDLSGVPAEIADVLRACLEKEPARRPTPRQLVQSLDESADLDGGWQLPDPLRQVIMERSALLITTPGLPGAPRAAGMPPAGRDGVPGPDEERSAAGGSAPGERPEGGPSADPAPSAATGQARAGTAATPGSGPGATPTPAPGTGGTVASGSGTGGTPAPSSGTGATATPGSGTGGPPSQGPAISGPGTGSTATPLPGPAGAAAGGSRPAPPVPGREIGPPAGAGAARPAPADRGPTRTGLRPGGPAPGGGSGPHPAPRAGGSGPHPRPPGPGRGGGYGLGVDLGTTRTAAAVWRDGRAETIALGERAHSVPSVLFLRGDGVVLVGDAAAQRGVAEPNRVAREFKRRFGDEVPLVLGNRPATPHELTGQLLRWVIETVTAREGSPPSHVTLTHPAGWRGHRLHLLVGAAAAAGRTDVGLLPEPVAAAAYYASTERLPTGALLAVYDLGGGTFDATVVRKTDTGFAIEGEPSGHDRLGGVDFDQVIIEHVAAAVGPVWHELDGNDPAVRSGLEQLRAAVGEAKEALSADVEAVIPVILPGVSTQVRITRGEFETAIRPALAHTVELLRVTIASAGATPEQLRAVLLVGGSSRIPLVTQLIQQELPVRVAVDADPKYAVCLGAAIAAGALLTPTSAVPRMAAAATVRVPGPVRPAPGPAGPGGPAVAVDLAATGIAGRLDVARPTGPPPQGWTPALKSRDDTGPRPAPPRPRSPLPAIVIGSVLAVAAIVGAVLLYPSGNGGDGGGGTTTPATATAPPGAPNTVLATVAVGGVPDGVAFAPDGSRAYVTDDEQDTLIVLDTVGRTEVARISVVDPVGVVVLGDGSVYVANKGAGTVSVIDPAQAAVVDEIAVGSTPLRLATDGARVFVGNLDDATVSVIDTATRTVVGEPIPVGPQPAHLTLTPDGSRLYVTSPGEDLVTVIDTASAAVVDRLTFRGGPFTVAFSPDGARSYVALNGQDAVIYGVPSDGGVEVARYDVGSGPVRVVVTPDGATLYVTNLGDGTVSAVDTGSGEVTAIPVGVMPTDAAITPLGTEVYVTDAGSGTVVVVGTTLQP